MELTVSILVEAGLVVCRDKDGNPVTGSWFSEEWLAFNAERPAGFTLQELLEHDRKLAAVPPWQRDPARCGHATQTPHAQAQSTPSTAA